MKARDIMTTSPATVVPSDSVSTAARVMRERGVGMLPVVDSPVSQHLVGVITDRDITTRCVADSHSGSCRVEEHMSRAPVQTASPSDSLDLVAKKMEAVRVRRLPVIGEGDRLVGVIAQADFATKTKASDRKLIEEVLQEISSSPSTAG